MDNKMYSIGIGCLLIVACSHGVQDSSNVLQASAPLPETLDGLILKTFPSDWEESIYAKGERRWRSGDELKWIGMPVGGFYAGQVHLGGDGTLWHWDVFNEHLKTAGEGYVNRMDPAAARERWLSSKPLEQVHQGFALKWKSKSGQGIQTLDKHGFKDVRFCGEYPMGLVEYRDAAVPLEVNLKAFSPFVPLHADDSAFPATVMEYTVVNSSDEPVEVELGGWLGNHVLLDTGAPADLMQRNNRISSIEGLTTLMCSTEPVQVEASTREDVVIDLFFDKAFEEWTVEGEAFGAGPVEKWEVDNYLKADANCPYGRLIHSRFTQSRKGDHDSRNANGRLLRNLFTVQRDYIAFWVAGGDAPGKTCVNLLVNGKVVDCATGQRDSMMRPAFFDVKQYAGKEVQLEVVVDHAGDEYNWISAAGFLQTDSRFAQIRDRSRDYGNMALSLLGNDPVSYHAGLSGKTPVSTWEEEVAGAVASAPVGAPLTGALRTQTTLEPGTSKTFAWLISWYFPNQQEVGSSNIHGRYYETRFADSRDVAQQLATAYERLKTETQLWHQTWYDSTLPWWFLDRSFQNICILATSTCRRYKSGQFWAWEGVGNCPGTCTHVWQYAQAMGRLFPELERDLRIRTDYGFGFMEDGGIRMRGNFLEAAVDGQAGIILRTYREHQMSPDNGFLEPIWPRVKKAMQYLIAKDNGEGLLEGAQHNTLDSDWYGQIAWLSSLYVAALRASEEMAMEMGDQAFADECRTRWQSGSRSMVEKLYNGKYFINLLDPDHLDSINSGTGCLLGQVMGQSWAFQVGLGRILPETETRSSLQALWDYNFTTDVEPFRAKYTNARDFAVAGDAGLMNCTFPDSGWDVNKAAGPNGNPMWVGYFNECQSGYEYETATHMIAEDMLTQGLSIVKAIDTRYDPLKRNPYNEVECGNFYSRSMAVYGAYLMTCGFEYHGPKGYMALAPKLSPDDFKAAFTAAEGWGTLEQKRRDNTQTDIIALKHGELELETVELEVADGHNVGNVDVSVLGKIPVESHFEQHGNRVTVFFAKREKLTVPQALNINLK